MRHFNPYMHYAYLHLYPPYYTNKRQTWYFKPLFHYTLHFIKIIGVIAGIKYIGLFEVKI